MKKILNKKGFTLIELIVVIAILAILALILVPSITGYITKANQAKDEANARTIYSQASLDAIGHADAADQTATLDATTCTWDIADETVTGFECGTVATPFLN